MRIKRWYWGLLALWAVTGLPIYLLGQAFAGQPPLSIEGLLGILDPPRISHFEAFITWLWPALLFLSPLLALPFALGKRQYVTVRVDDTVGGNHHDALRRRRVATWYWIVLAVWVAGGFWYVFPVAFADGRFSGQSLVSFMAPQETSLEAILIWIWTLILISLPLVLIPFALVHQRRNPESDVTDQA